MHAYRTHHCNALRKDHVGETVRLSGWVHRVRDHGGLLFVDLRDHHGITQCVVEDSSPFFAALNDMRVESVITLTGKVVARTPETVNTKLATGDIELLIEDCQVISTAEMLPITVNSEAEFPEETRLRYRFLDLRREQLHNRIMTRVKVIAAMREKMKAAGFNEFQTPILTASSPEGARDYLVPSRMHPGKFYALPQAPQMFKQLLMVAGFDRYFQIAPCFRDEDARADRLVGDFYQLDLEMSFVTQEDVFQTMEPIITGIFKEFAPEGYDVNTGRVLQIPYEVAMMKYGTDKPDLRNPLVLSEVSEVFAGSEFKVFAGAVEKGSSVRAIPAPKTADRPRSFFDKMNDWARSEGAPGLGYIIFEAGEAKGPIGKFITGDRLARLKEITGLGDGDAVFFACDVPDKAAKLAGKARNIIGRDLGLYEEKAYRFCWITDFPMYELDEKTGKVEFSHNPFSMPQGGVQTLDAADPLTIKAYQYDFVCNGYELASGSIRNQTPEGLFKAFAIAGYGKEVVEDKFKGMLNAFQYGAPPHGGAAFGIERIIMLLTEQENVREVVTFPMNQQGEDLMLGAPTVPSDLQLKELSLKLNLPPKKEKDEDKVA